MAESKPALKVNDIRPEHLLAGQNERFQADLQRMLRRKAEFVTVPCPACAADRYQPAFQKYELDYVRCLDCETVFMNPRPTVEVLDEYYSKSENYWYWNNYIFPASEAVRKERIFVPRVDRILDICHRQGIACGTLLEIGSGFGTFCREMKSRQVFERVIAVEPTPDLAATCRSHGLEVVESRYEDLSLPATSVDVIVSFEVIEHIFAADHFVATCAGLLRPGGLLVLTCPNIKGFETLVLQSLSDAVDCEHLNYFHPASLARLVERCGFEVVEVSTPGKLDVDLVRQKVTAGVMDLSGQPFLQTLVMDGSEALRDAFQQFLSSHGLSSHQWIVARRRAEEPAS